jgi:hypothetical protein
MNTKIEIGDRHFDYLRIQKGNLDEVSDDRERWHAAYEADLQRQFQSFAAYLPAQCSRLLDVGSGLGGIDILIRRHYETRGQHPYVWLLDGEADPPEMNLHRETFNDMRVAKDFQVLNGLDPRRFGWWSPRTIRPGPVTPYDLIVSFGSWCFHYPPSTYLAPLLNSGLHADTVLVLDVRATKASYMWELEEHFEAVATVAHKPKWQRIVFKVKAA